MLHERAQRSLQQLTGAPDARIANLTIGNRHVFLLSRSGRVAKQNKRKTTLDVYPVRRHLLFKRQTSLNSIMKITVIIARYLLGIVFLVFGLNGFFHFIPSPPPTGLAGQFAGALFVSHYLVAVFLLQLVGGVLLLANRFVPLALSLLGPVIVNIILFHALMAPEGLGLALVVTALWFVVFYAERRAFSGVFLMKGVS